MAKWTIPTEMAEGPTVALLRAENKRLREALQAYANSCDAVDGEPCFYGCNMCCKTAREALEETKEPTP